jgi:hypothetical protein
MCCSASIVPFTISVEWSRLYTIKRRKMSEFPVSGPSVTSRVFLLLERRWNAGTLSFPNHPEFSTFSVHGGRWSEFCKDTGRVEIIGVRNPFDKRRDA